MGASEVVADAKYLWRRIEEAVEGSEITKWDLFAKCKGKFETVSDIEPALSNLAESNYIHELDVATGGRPSIRILINPLAIKGKNRDSLPVCREEDAAELL